MVDVWLVVSNSLWITGLSLLLATISWASWTANIEDIRLYVLLARPGMRRAWGLGIALFCTGMATTGHAWWEWGLWGTLAVGFMTYAFGASVAKTLGKKGKVS